MEIAKVAMTVVATVNLRVEKMDAMMVDSTELLLAELMEYKKAGYWAQQMVLMLVDVMVDERVR
jgi:hypothetical protein